MRKIYRFKSIPFFLWNARHEFYHVLLGLVWAWVLREVWNEFNPRWIGLSVFASLLPDAEHLVYFVTYGKRDNYTEELKSYIRSGQWRKLWLTLQSGHKQNTNLALHNFYFMVILLLVSLVSFFFEWQTSVILFGAMLIHYMFDIVDDILMLGYINPNWKRWGRGK